MYPGNHVFRYCDRRQRKMLRSIRLTTQSGLLTGCKFPLRFRLRLPVGKKVIPLSANIKGERRTPVLNANRHLKLVPL